MVHPTQNGSALGRPPATVISFARSGRVWSCRLKPWATASILALIAAGAALLVGSAAYLLYRDDLLGGSLSRQVALQYSYEERIAALRGELDRLTSSNGMAAKSVEAQVAMLLDRQTEIAARQSELDGLVATARKTGIELAMANPLPAPRRDEPTPRPSADAGAPLAYAPIELTGVSAASTATDSTELRRVSPALEQIEAALDTAKYRQSEALQSLEAASSDRLGALGAALAPLGVGPPQGEESGPQGGPFIPVTELHFVERAALLNHVLDDIASLRRTAAALPLRAPLPSARVTSRFGYRNDPFLSRPALHAGIDFASPEGAAVRATAAGTVVSAGWSGGYGQMVEVQHARGLVTRYGHLSEIRVQPGMRVTAGSVIGRVGSTGRSTGPHLHYETRRDGEPVNPDVYLTAGRKIL